MKIYISDFKIRNTNFEVNPKCKLYFR